MLNAHISELHLFRLFHQILLEDTLATFDELFRDSESNISVSSNVLLATDTVTAVLGSSAYGEDYREESRRYFIFVHFNLKMIKLPF